MTEPKRTIEVRMTTDDGIKAFGTIERVIRGGLHTPKISLAGIEVQVQDGHTTLYVYVWELPRDMNPEGYE